MSKAKRLRVLLIRLIQLRPLQQERRSALCRPSPSVSQPSRQRLQPSASGFPTRPSRTRDQIRRKERPGTPPALRSFASVREGLRGSVRRACLRDPSTASRRVRPRVVWFACRCSLATVRRLASPFSFSRNFNLKISQRKRPDNSPGRCYQRHGQHVAGIDQRSDSASGVSFSESSSGLSGVRSKSKSSNFRELRSHRQPAIEPPKIRHQISIGRRKRRGIIWSPLLRGRRHGFRVPRFCRRILFRVCSPSSSRRPERPTG